MRGQVKTTVRFLNEELTHLARRAGEIEIIQAIAIDIANGQPGTELRKFPGQERFAREVVEGPFAVAREDGAVAGFEQSHRR